MTLTVDCRAYREHQFLHRREGAGFVCPACGVAGRLGVPVGQSSPDQTQSDSTTPRLGSSPLDGSVVLTATTRKGPVPYSVGRSKEVPS